MVDIVAVAPGRPGSRDRPPLCIFNDWNCSAHAGKLETACGTPQYAAYAPAPLRYHNFSWRIRSFTICNDADEVMTSPRAPEIVRRSGADCGASLRFQTSAEGYAIQGSAEWLRCGGSAPRERLAERAAQFRGGRELFNFGAAAAGVSRCHIVSAMSSAARCFKSQRLASPAASHQAVIRGPGRRRRAEPFLFLIRVRGQAERAALRGLVGRARRIG